MLERERHDDLIAELREAGAKVNLIRDGDVAPAIAASQPETGVDLLMGIGGTPEGVITAAALKCAGGGMQGRLWPRNDEERAALVDAGFELEPRPAHRRPRRPATTSSWRRPGLLPVRSCAGFGIPAGGAITDSIVMRSRSGTVRRIEARHALAKLRVFTGREYT